MATQTSLACLCNKEYHRDEAISRKHSQENNVKTVVISAFGEPDVLHVAEQVKPAPGKGQALLAVEASGVGLVDVLMRMGAYPGLSEPGFVPGVEVAGTVAAVGEGVDQALVGSAAYALVGIGGYAEFVAVDAAGLVPIPSGVTAADAVALGVNTLVARFALERAGVKMGERVLVRGATGGIGVAAVQIAKAMGAIVVAATGSVEGGARLGALGASEIVDRAASNLSEDVDVVIDPVAGTDMAAFIGRLKANGRMVVMGFAGSFPAPEFGMALMANFQKSLTLMTLSLNTIPPPALLAAAADLFAFAATGSIKAVIHETVGFDQLVEAHRQLQSGTPFGKLVARP
jgi:NADPH:quinone reductase-like Zn-dependent oxidoreductase